MKGNTTWGENAAVLMVEQEAAIIKYLGPCDAVG